METPARKNASTVSRISMSLPPELLGELDEMVHSRGYGNRSRAISEMVRYQLVEHKRTLGNEIMVGTLNLLYDRAARGVQKQLADLQYEHLDEVISSLHVHLAQNQVLEVLLVQGPALKLQDIANQMIATRGVITGQLHLLAAVIPPITSPLTVS